MKAGNDPTPARLGSSAWYRQPIVWLGVLVFAGSMGGCIWLIMVGNRYADTPLDTSHTVFGVPVSAHSSPPAPTSTDPPR